MRNRCLLLLLLMSMAAPAASQSTVGPALGQEVRSLSLDNCITLALENNLGVQVERLNPVIQGFNLKAAYGSYDPSLFANIEERFRKSDVQFDPQFNQFIGGDETTTDSGSAGLSGLTPIGMTYNLNTTVTRNTGNRFIGEQYFSSVQLQLTQPLLRNFWIDGARRSIRSGKISMRSSELQLRENMRNVVRQVELGYFNLISAIRAVKVREQSLALGERLLRDNRKKIEVGTMAPLEEKQAESDVANRTSALIGARQTVGSQQNSLISLLTDNFAEWADVYVEPADALLAVEESFDRIASWEAGMLNRPDLELQRLTLEQQNIQLKFSRNQLFPQLDLIGSYSVIGLDSNPGDTFSEAARGRNPQYSFGAQLTIPLGNRNARNTHRANKARQQQALLNLKNSEQQVLSQIDNAIRTARGEFMQVNATMKATEYAQAALEAEEKKLANGASTTFQVLQLQQSLTEAQLSEINAIADYNRALVELRFHMGTNLERHNLELEIE